MPKSLRLSLGGIIDRKKPVNFQFNGRQLCGYKGDTLASALLANGIHLVSRSFKYHRPRGIFASGTEEPNALVQLEVGPRTLASHQATRIKLYEGLKAFSANCWPSPTFDLLGILGFFHRILPAGFYYKTFMWPRWGWKIYEYLIRHIAGLGHCPRQPDPDRYDHMNAHTDILIIGSGPSGLAAAIEASNSSARIIIVDENSKFGGRLLSDNSKINNKNGPDWAVQQESILASNPNVKMLKNTTAFGYYDHNLIGMIENLTDPITGVKGKKRQRLWKIRAKQVVLAQGAFERPLVFSDNDRPGIMLAGAIRTFLNKYAVIPGRRVALFVNNDDAYRTALDLNAHGVEVVVVIDLRKEVTGVLPNRTISEGIEVVEDAAITSVIGKSHVKKIEVMMLSEDGKSVQGEKRFFDCDLIGISGGWNPAVHLHSHSNGKTVWRKDDGVFIPGKTLQDSISIGACSGNFSLQNCLKDGWAAGKKVVKLAGFSSSKSNSPKDTENIPEQPWRNIWIIPSNAPAGQNDKHFVDQQHDVTAADIQLAAREGYQSVEHTKRYTTLGMATDQGKTSNIPGHAILAEILGKEISVIGTTTFRPPYTPVTIGAFAGPYTGHLFAPIRRSPMHYWHESNGAIWEDVGEWKRPWYYPKRNESMHDAVARECLATRNSVGILDASTLGKIDIQGPDSAEFLNRIYTNNWENLEIGCCRYGIMLREDGMVMDDGVTSRLGKNHYLMTTTTGNAASVLAWLEEWSQTEWPTLKVYFTSVTEQYATITLSGPNARLLLEEFTNDIDLGSDAFPAMQYREGTIGGLRARVFRISFTGECAFEINVQASGGANLWTNFVNAGEKYGITPYGTETMHVLRAEKGYIIVGQETDGTVTPYDLGMTWIISKNKDFIGRRSLDRPDTARNDRKQLVGLLPDNKTEVLPEGGQIVSQLQEIYPMPMIGHVTSSYHSPILDRSFALALIKGGRKRLGQKVHVPLEDRTITCQVTSHLFYDKEGHKLNG